MHLSLTFLFFLCFIPASFAEGFRCKTGQFIKTGDTVKDVIAKCGKPDDKSFKYVEVVKRDKVKKLKQIIWIYKPGKFQFEQHLTIYNRKVTAIERGARIK
ncbi:DUF2845 domain-containing protein [Catenovulum sediminis]|uniref:DUF2845 domain-containing protein n=1 Tax=Catenovulum sediminis TaxID=1740262 RepID=A0ABV1RJL7_9ALTE